MFSPFDPLQFKILAEKVFNDAESYCPSECNLECMYRTKPRHPVIK